MLGSRSLSRALVPLLALWLAAPAAGKPPPFADPPSLESEGGVLAVTLDASPSEILIKKKRVTSNVYNGLYVPPLLRLGHGDMLEVQTVTTRATCRSTSTATASSPRR